jgi:diguanylate cyclase (GGDEF)-like protein
MNDKNFNSALLLAILLTLIAMLGAQFLPSKRLGLDNNLYDNLFLHTENLPDGSASAEYDSPERTKWHCTVPEDFKGDYFACSFGMNLASTSTQGVDLSHFSQLNLKLHYQGNANKIRIAIRNYNSAYSTPEDGNSSKFNSIQIHTRKLNKELHLALNAFSVSEWWLAQYNIPLEYSQPDISNAMIVTIDFAEKLSPGRHDFDLEKLEFEGELISTEHWYLSILSMWMLGIFIFALYRLIQLHQQSKHDTQVINTLSSTNEQLQRETNKFRRLSTVDPLTQLYNRFGIDQIIASLAGNDQLQMINAHSYSLLVMDIDHFKRVNDQRGHDTGDLVLQHIAKLIQKHLRTGDFVGRWGGEEFIIILPCTTLKLAVSIAEIIRNAIFTSQYNLETPLSISASFGICEKQPDEDFASCFKRADNALYKAKENGRNCCITAEAHL